MVNEAALVPISLQESKLSPKQQEEIFKAAKKYLIEQRIPLEDLKILGSAILVVSDALKRGMLAQEILIPGPKERLSPYIKDGLTRRDELIEEAKKYCSVVRGTSPFHTEYSGALAISQSLFISCNHDLQNTKLLTQLENIESFTLLTQSREKAVEQLANTALSNLPEPLSKVNIEQFPSINERAKITRNMISSYIFRGTLSPVITIDELKRMAFAGSISTDLFNTQKFDDLVKTLNLDGEVLDTAKAFFHQTKEVFSKIPPIPLDSQDREADFFYTYFSRDLLLLHPALEEERIITDPLKITSGIPSIWDRGFRIDNLLIPQPEMLIRTIRQTRARGFEWEAIKLQKALTAWRWSERAEPELEDKIAKAEQKLSLLKGMLQSALNGDELPQKAFFIIYKDQEIAKAKTERQEKITQGVHKIIEDNIKRREAAKQYQSRLIEKYGETLPRLVEAPVLVDIREKEDQIKLNQYRIGQLKTNLKLYDKMLSLDYFWGKNYSDQTLSLTIPGSSEIIGQAIKGNNQLLEQLQTGVVNIEQLYDQQVVNLFKRYKTWLKLDSKNMFRLPFELSKWLEKWREIEAEEMLSDKEIKQEMLISLTQIRSRVLNRAFKHSKEYDQLSDLSSSLRRDIVLLQNQNPATLSDTRRWDRQQAAEFIQQIEASVPNITGLDQGEIKKISSRVKTLLRFRYPMFGSQSLLPSECLDTAGTRLFINIKLNTTAIRLNQLETSISEIEDRFKDPMSPALKKLYSIEYNELMVEQSNLSKSYNWALQLFEILDSPLFSLELCQGLPMNAALDALSERATVANALCEIDESEQLSQEIREYYLSTVRDIFTQTLRQKIEGQEEHIQMLKSTGLKGQLAAKIDLMGLAIKT